MSKKVLISLLASLIVFLSPAVAFAHVIVTPKQVGVGQEVLFNESVPNEQQTPVTSVKLLIPQGVTNVIPTEKANWTIATTSNNSTSNPEITSITWTGSMPVGQRDDFTFSAQVPGSPTEINWKAYQTYGDGTVVHWDQKPAGSDDSTGNAGPYSVTKVVNDLTNPQTTTTNNDKTGTYALVISIIAIIFSLGALFIRKKK